VLGPADQRAQRRRGTLGEGIGRDPGPPERLGSWRGQHRAHQRHDDRLGRGLNLRDQGLGHRLGSKHRRRREDDQGRVDTGVGE
jgi:hypothetical protein